MTELFPEMVSNPDDVLLSLMSQVKMEPELKVRESEKVMSPTPLPPGDRVPLIVVAPPRVPSPVRVAPELTMTSPVAPD